MSLTRRARALAALTAASALTLSACGDDSGGQASSSTNSSAPSGSSSSTATSSTDGASAADGTATASTSGLTFDVPDGWETINPSELADHPDTAPASVTTMAESAGMPVDQFLTQLSQTVDVIVMGEAKKATVTSTQEVTTPAGKAPKATYTMKVGTQTVHGQMIAAPSDAGAGVITVSTLDKDETATIARAITDSVDTAS